MSSLLVGLESMSDPSHLSWLNHLTALTQVLRCGRWCVVVDRSIAIGRPTSSYPFTRAAPSQPLDANRAAPLFVVLLASSRSLALSLSHGSEVSPRCRLNGSLSLTCI